jgi:hypothetical protein
MGLFYALTGTLRPAVIHGMFGWSVGRATAGPLCKSDIPVTLIRSLGLRGKVTAHLKGRNHPCRGLAEPLPSPCEVISSIQDSRTFPSNPPIVMLLRIPSTAYSIFISNYQKFSSTASTAMFNVQCKRKK